MNKQRLLRLAEFLETKVPKHKFNLKCWMADSDWVDAEIEDGSPSKKIKTTRDKEKYPSAFTKKGRHQLIPINCQTVGCALGWGSTIPSFKKAGLALINRKTLNDDNLTADIALIKNGRIVATHFEAAASFFQIPLREANWLFDPWEYVYSQHKNPKYVAKRIRKLLAGKAKGVQDGDGSWTMSVRP